jgi:hypothetical protein
MAAKFKIYIALMIIIDCLPINLINCQLFEMTESILPKDIEANSCYGWSVDISGNFAIVGAMHEDEDALGKDSLTNAGAAYIFEKDNNWNWVQVQKLVASDRSENDFFGWSVAISGNYAFIDARLEDEDSSGNNTIKDAGSVYVFKRNGNGQWIETQKIVSLNRHVGNCFGSNLSVSDRMAAISSPTEGIVYILVKENNGQWTHNQQITDSDLGPDDRSGFGSSIEISDSIIIIGNPSRDEDSVGVNSITDAGAAYIFKCNKDGICKEIQVIVASDRTEYGNFGQSTSIDYPFAILGSQSNNYDASGENPVKNAGAAYIFKCGEDGHWNEIQKIVAHDRAEEDMFGVSVALSEDFAMVGAPNKNANMGHILKGVGSAYMFHREENDQWVELQKIVSPDQKEFEWFGYVLALSKNHCIIGNAMEDNVNVSSAHICELCPPAYSNSDNIVENGNFQYCRFFPWQVFLNNPINLTANPVLVDGECFISDITVEDNPKDWHIQLLQTFTDEQKSKLDPGYLYRLSFEARTLFGVKQLYIFLGQNQGAWISYINETITIDNKLQTYSFEFTFEEVFSLVRLLFGVGIDEKDIVFDNIELVKLYPVTDTYEIRANEELNDGILLFPNPASRYLYIQGMNGSTVRLIDMSGKVIHSSIITKNLESFDLHETTEGLYTVQITKENFSSLKKIIIKKD